MKRLFLSIAISVMTIFTLISLTNAVHAVPPPQDFIPDHLVVIKEGCDMDNGAIMTVDDSWEPGKLTVSQRVDIRRGACHYGDPDWYRFDGNTDLLAFWVEAYRYNSGEMHALSDGPPKWGRNQWLDLWAYPDIGVMGMRPGKYYHWLNVDFAIGNSDLGYFRADFNGPYIWNPNPDPNPH